MGVDVRRGGKVAVAQPLLNVLEGNAVGQQQAGTAVTQKSKRLDFLRYTFEINNIVIPLSVELNFAIEYVKMMKYRYGDKISLKINHDKSRQIT